MKRERVYIQGTKAHFTAFCQHLFLLSFIFSFSLLLPQLLIMLAVNLIKYKQSPTAQSTAKLCWSQNQATKHTHTQIFDMQIHKYIQCLLPLYCESTFITGLLHCYSVGWIILQPGELAGSCFKEMLDEANVTVISKRMQRALIDWIGLTTNHLGLLLCNVQCSSSSACGLTTGHQNKTCQSDRSGFSKKSEKTSFCASIKNTSFTISFDCLYGARCWAYSPYCAYSSCV